MSIDARRLRPTRATLAGLVAAVIAVAMGAARDFVWADLRAGLLTTVPLPRFTRALVRVGFAAVFLMVAAMLFNGVLRNSFPLLAATRGTPGRGVLVPVALLPLTMCMVALAWSLLLTGALHSHPALRVGLVVAYIGTTIAWVGLSLFDTGWRTYAAWAALAAAPTFFAVRWRRPVSARLEFPVMLLVVGVAYAAGHASLLDTYRASGVPVFISEIEITLLQLRLLTMPLLILIGLDVADFAYRTSTWVVGVVAERLGRVTLALGFAAALGWLLRHVIVTLARSAADGGLAGYAGAAGVPVIVGLSWLVVNRLDRDTSDDDRAPEVLVATAVRNAGRLAFGFAGWQLAVTVAVFVVFGWVAIRPGDAMTAVAHVASTVTGFGSSANLAWRVIFDAVVFAAGLAVARRGRHVVALYLVLVGALDAWTLLTSASGPLHGVVWASREPVTFWWTVAILAITAGLLFRRRMTTARAQGLLIIVAVLLLSGRENAIEDPFSPFFPAAGLGLIAFGIAWDAITVGSWANGDSRALPRINRMLLYLGYVLFSVTLINWAVTTHNLADVEFFTDGAATIGLDQFGVPLLYGIYALTLARILGADTAPGLVGAVSADRSSVAPAAAPDELDDEQHDQAEDNDHQREEDQDRTEQSPRRHVGDDGSRRGNEPA